MASVQPHHSPTSVWSESAGSSAWQSTTASAIGESSLRTSSPALGVERTVRTRNRNGPARRGPSTRKIPLSENDKINLDVACLCFISIMCQSDCYPLPGQVKNDMVVDAVNQANAIAFREKRATTAADNFFNMDVSHIFYSFQYLRLIISCRYVTLAQSGGRTSRRLSPITCMNGRSALHRR